MGREDPWPGSRIICATSGEPKKQNRGQLNLMTPCQCNIQHSRKHHTDSHNLSRITPSLPQDEELVKETTNPTHAAPIPGCTIAQGCHVAYKIVYICVLNIIGKDIYIYTFFRRGWSEPSVERGQGYSVQDTAGSSWLQGLSHTGESISQTGGSSKPTGVSVKDVFKKGWKVPGQK